LVFFPFCLASAPYIQSRYSRLSTKFKIKFTTFQDEVHSTHLPRALRSSCFRRRLLPRRVSPLIPPSTLNSNPKTQRFRNFLLLPLLHALNPRGTLHNPRLRTPQRRDLVARQPSLHLRKRRHLLRRSLFRPKLYQQERLLLQGRYDAELVYEKRAAGGADGC
jgi:hypothetical protein